MRYMCNAYGCLFGSGMSIRSTNFVEQANRLFREGRYESALNIYEALIEEQPRNHWLHLSCAHACLKLGRLMDARRWLERVSESSQVGHKIVNAMRELSERLTVAAAAPEFVLDYPVEYHCLKSQGRVLGRPPRIESTREVLKGWPYNFVLPEVVGNANDFQFLDDVYHQVTGQPSWLPRTTVGVVLWPESEQWLADITEDIANQTLTSEQVSVMVCGSNMRCTPTAKGYDGASGVPWKEYAGSAGVERLAGYGTLVFLAEGLRLEAYTLEEIVRRAAVYQDIVLVLEPSRSVHQRDGDESGSGQLRARRVDSWLRERYPFRRLDTLGFAMSGALFRKIGGFDARFETESFAVRELSYRAYNLGAYFVPVAVGGTSTRERDEEVEVGADQSDACLFPQLCPAHWYRKRDGVFDVPKVSVYVPAYNCEKYICDAIDSVLLQDFKDLEVCVWLDGAVDGTEQLIRERYRNEPRVRYRVGRNGGIGFASNRAVQMAKGMYIGQLDSDDRLKPGAIRRLVDFLDEHANIGCVYTSCERIDADGSYIRDEYEHPVFSREKMLLTSIVHHFRMFRRQAWGRTAGFREDITNAVDYDMYLKLADVAHFSHLREVHYQRRWHGQNTSKMKEHLQTENTHLVQRKALDRMGVSRYWRVEVPDKDNPRKIEYGPACPMRYVYVWPDYSRSNPYQKLLYQNEATSVICAGDIDAAIRGAIELDEHSEAVFHLHWLNPIVKDVQCEKELAHRCWEFACKIDRFKEHGGRFVWTIHNVVSHDSVFPRIESAFSSQLAHKADVIHVHSAASMSEIERLFRVPRERVRIAAHGTYHGYYPDFISRGTARECLGIRRDEVTLLFFGQMRPYKGLEELMEALLDLRKRGVIFRVILAGKSSEGFDQLLKHEYRDLQEQVTVLDQFVADNDVQVLFRAADFAVFPYRNILTSGSLMLALTYGVPPIIPSVGMTWEVVGHVGAGIVYGRVGYAESLADGLLSAAVMHEDGRAACMRKRAREAGEVWHWQKLFSHRDKAGAMEGVRKSVSPESASLADMMFQAPREWDGHLR